MRSSRFSIVGVVSLCATLAFAWNGQADVDPQSYFVGCGEIVSLPYPQCTALATDTGEVYLLDQMAGFDVGDRVFVNGRIDSDCISVCYVACLVNNSIEPCPTPPGDLNGDGTINVQDLLIVLENWGECDVPYNCPADLDGDEVVDVNDLLFLLNQWG